MTTFDSEEAAEIQAQLHSHLPSDPALRVMALESLVVERGLVDPADLDAWVELYASQVGPRRGAEVVARCWTDPDFRSRLLADAGRVVHEVGYHGHATGHLQAVENTATLHNVIVCTLCSCYPFALLGMSPAWYKSAAYRARVVREPRKVLAEFGVDLGPDVAVRVWDSTAELRYLVIPERPAGTEGWSVERLTDLVSRDAMIGTRRDLGPV
jgi:nitrile hydratase